MSRTTVDHPAGTGLGGLKAADRIADHSAALVASLGRIEAWMRRHAADIRSTSHVAGDSVYVWPAREDDEVGAYHRLVSSLPEIVPTGALDSIEPPGTRTQQTWTEAWIGPVRIVVYAPAEACERVQVGTETVEVPDPDAPKIIEERPVYEYRCTDGVTA